MRIVPLLAVAGTACASLGGGVEEEFNVAAIRVEGGADPASTVATITAAGAHIVLLSAERDSAWFASVAASTGLELSGPGASSGRGLAFLTNLEILGDTSIMLNVDGGGVVHMHDALYRIDEERNIDLMLVRFEGDDLRAGVRTLLSYIATDVGANASVLLGVDAASPQAADSAAVLVRATLTSALECAGETERDAAARLRLLYGPSALLQCVSARPLDNGVFARVRVR